MTDQNKENESKELKPGFFVVADESIKQALFATDTLVAQGWTLMDVQTGAVSVEFQHLFDGMIVNDEHIPSIAERLEAFGRLTDECAKWKDQLNEERKAYNALLNQTDDICAAVGVTSGKTSLDMVRDAVKRVDLLCTEQDQLREALGIDVTVDLVDEVRRLKQAQEEAVPEQVMALQATIQRSDEQWNKVCEALGLPDKGRTSEAQVVVHAHETAKALEVTEAKVEAFRAMNSIIQDNWDLHTSMDGNPVHMLGQLMDELQRLRRAAKYGEHENTEHVSKELAQTLANGLVSKENRIKEMDEALETSLMEIAKQAQVIDELRSQLKAAQRQCESQRAARRAAEGKIDGLERAIEIIGGRR